MTTGEKITKLRKENNMTQEQLADLLEVSRQSVSKWESDLAFPETEKLLRLSNLFDCTVDYLLKESLNEPKDTVNKISNKPFSWKLSSFEYTSKQKIGTHPLIHVCFNPKKVARGVVAVGFRAKGILSFGLLSMGILSFGVLSFGMIALGSFALGLLALGAVSAGVFVLGGIAFGMLFAVGGVAVGTFACGGCAIGSCAAFGDYAKAKVAIGMTYANGSVWSHCGKLLEQDKIMAIEKIRTVTPTVLLWLADLVRMFAI